MRDLARHAHAAGADAIIAITPVFLGNIRRNRSTIISSISAPSIDLPLIAYNSPSYLDGIEFTGELTARLIQRLPNLVGMKEASFNSEKFFEILRAALPLRPTFAMIAGVEYLLPSVSSRRCRVTSSSASAICPNLCVDLYESCANGNWDRARELQYKLSQLWLIFRDQYPSSLKGGCVIMGRPVGPTSPPLPTASPERIKFIEKQLDALGILDSEPHGW